MNRKQSIWLLSLIALLIVVAITLGIVACSGLTNNNNNNDYDDNQQNNDYTEEDDGYDDDNDTPVYNGPNYNHNSNNNNNNNNNNNDNDTQTPDDSEQTPDEEPEQTPGTPEQTPNEPENTPGQPETTEPAVLYGMTQSQVDAAFSSLLDGIFTGKTTETITTTGIGAEFGFHFPDITYYNGQYWAYYITYQTNSGKGGVGLAVSNDGKTWTNKGCVIQPSEYYDSNGAYFAGVWIDNGIFYLVYECKGGEGTPYFLENVALAISEDGINWEKRGIIINRSGTGWQEANVGTPDLYKVGDTWYVTYHGFDYKDCVVGIAYGKNLLDLTVVTGVPVINTQDGTAWSGTVGRRDVIYCDGYYYMVFEVSTDQVGGNFNGAKWSHMFARSTDMFNWTLCSGPLITQSTTGMGYDGPCWMVIDNELYVYMRQGASTTAVKLVPKA